MKVLMDIDAKEYADIMYVSNSNPRDLSHYERLIARGTPIEDNATIGDVIKTMFPNLQIIKGYEMVHIIVDRFESVPLSYDLWNTVYGKEMKKPT